LVGCGALMGVLVYALQFQKACGDSTPYQCMASFVGWMQQGLLAPRQDASEQSNKETASIPPPPPKVEPASAPPPPQPKLEPAPAVPEPPPPKAEPAPGLPPPPRAEPAPVEPPKQLAQPGTGPRSASPPPPAVADRRFTVVNSGTVTLMEFFATRCSVDHWGRDLLGRDVIPAGQHYQFNLDTSGQGSCCYDLRARFQGGQQRTNMGVNICNVGTWTVGN
jgi:hypothetical protein